jgi:hypothetical protein
MAYRCNEGTWHTSDEIDAVCQYCETPYCGHNGGWRQSLKPRQQQCDECRRDELKQWLEKKRSAGSSIT